MTLRDALCVSAEFPRRVTTAMAQYFDFPVRITPADDNVDVISAKWCDLEQTVAISTRMKRLHFVQEEVCGPVSACFREKFARLPCLAACLRSNFLCVVCCRSRCQGNPVRDPIQRNCNCSLIAWRPNSNYVVSGWDDGAEFCCCGG
jgi:hypothetical protein